MSGYTEDFARQTTHVAPALASVLQEHLEDFDEMLPHLYFGDISRWVVDELAKPSPSQEVRQLLDLFESTYPTAHDDVQNLIDVSFIEMVQDDPSVVRLFGPPLLSRVDDEYLPRR